MTYPYEKHVPSRAEIVIGMAADAIRRWRNRCELASFVRESPNEAARVAADLGIDTGTLVKIAAHSGGPPLLLNRRLKLLGLDPEQLRRREPAAARDMVRCCTLCGHKGRCSRDLAGKSESGAWKQYCPNASTLAALMPLRTGLAAAL